MVGIDERQGAFPSCAGRPDGPSGKARPGGIWRTLLFMVLCAMPSRLPAETVEQVILLPTRPQVLLPYLLRVSLSGPPRAVAILFPGGEGVVGLPRDGSKPQLGSRGNFLVRTRDLLCDPEVAVAVVDAPSDQPGGMDDAFRSGRQHREDIAALLSDLQVRLPGARLFLVGTSRGTLSAAHLGLALGDKVQGVVLTSSVLSASRKQGPGLQGFDFEGIKAPILFVHHEQDGCPVCPYVSAEKQGRRFPLITVRGGLPPESGPCAPLSHHGFFGREGEVITAIRAWILGLPFATRIG
jgi:hypothetical protein